MVSQTFQPTAISSLEFPRFQSVGAALFVLGVMTTFFGFGWDLQWHIDVGPDTFWTLPHLFVYAGAALSGFACLTVVLLSSFSTKEIRSQPGMISIFGFFHAPVGFVIGGFGAFGFLVWGLFDQYWHDLFGFDATVASPPHLGLLFSFMLATTGCVLVFIRGKNIKPQAFVLATALSLSFMLPFILFDFAEFRLDIAMFLFPAWFLTFGMIFVASATRKPWLTLVMTLVFAVLRYVSWFVIPVLNVWYASSLGLALRDQPSPVPQFPYFMPMLLPLAGLAASGILAFAKARGWRVIPSVLLAGAISAPLIYVDLFLGEIVLSFPIILVGVVALGILGAWMGWQMGVVVRHANHELEAVQA